MKITILGFDIWGYVGEIAKFLEKQGHEVHFINSTLYQFPHRNILFKSKNFFAKAFLSKNLKKESRDVEIGKLVKSDQDFTLIVNPGEYNNKLLTQIRNSTNILVGWNYDSAKRKKITSFHTTIFDQLLTFDRIDALKREELQFLPNFNYKSKSEISNQEFKYKAYTILNQDFYRLKILDRIAQQVRHGFEQQGAVAGDPRQGCWGVQHQLQFAFFGQRQIEIVQFPQQRQRVQHQKA